MQSGLLPIRLHKHHFSLHRPNFPNSCVREAANDEVAQTSYLNLLRAWFKNINFTGKVVAAAYMTGILPIKKDGFQSNVINIATSN